MTFPLDLTDRRLVMTTGKPASADMSTTALSSMKTRVSGLTFLLIGEVTMQGSDQVCEVAVNNPRQIQRFCVEPNGDSISTSFRYAISRVTEKGNK